MNNSKRLLALAVSAAIAAPMSAFATNGMNLEGYGPIATGMGGASMAYDNGTAAMMNNPATLGMMADGSRLDIALGNLGPNVDSKAPSAMGGANASSGGDSYKMPALGWAKHSGKLAYGVGMFAQGGMGTEYDKNSWISSGTGDDSRSELGVGRLMVPLAYNVNDNLTVGGSIDYVWGGLDMKMALPIMNSGSASAGTFADFMPAFGGKQVLGEATMTSGFLSAFQTQYGSGYDTVQLNFSDNNDFTQKTKGTGMGGKIGVAYKVNKDFSVGATYHLKTAMSDWKGDAKMVMFDTDGSKSPYPIAGKIKIKDFQWPATMAAGFAFTPSDRWMIAGDVKVLKWSDVMKDFSMEFTPDSMAGQKATIKFYQDWDDQTVYSLGASYMATDAMTLRFGANVANNPIPKSYVNPLFPATVENHYTAGLGYMFSKTSAVNFSATYAPEVSVKNSNTGAKITHSQTNWQLMYSQSF
jgi:long-chain fatty acid transport protein